MLAMLIGESHVYKSSDTFYKSSDHPDIDDINPPETLYGFNISGLPNHEIHLKFGTPIVLLRNLDTSLGLLMEHAGSLSNLGKRLFKHGSLLVKILAKRC